MEKIEVSIVTLGNLKKRVDLKRLSQWKSGIFKIKCEKSIPNLPDSEGESWEYTDEQLRGLIKNDARYGFTLGITSAPLSYNFYLRRISSNIAVISLYEMVDILERDNFLIEDFIIRSVYELAVLFAGAGGEVPSSAYSWAHVDIRGCLLDLNGNKADIIHSMHKPILCDECRAKLQSSQIDRDLLKILDGELRKIKKKMYYRIIDKVKDHPVLALSITTIWAAVINIASNYIFDLIK